MLKGAKDGAFFIFTTITIIRTPLGVKMCKFVHELMCQYANAQAKIVSLIRYFK